MSLPPLLIRADAGTQMGTGHVMRCLALAQAWHEAGGTAHLAAATCPPAVEARLAAEGVTVHCLDAPPAGDEDAAATAALAWQVGAGWAVVDGYHLDAAYRRALKAAGLLLLTLDDAGTTADEWADLLLNQNVVAPAGQATRTLLGTHYALLRREFWPWRDWQRPAAATARRVLVTMGGTDPDNVTLHVLRSLRSLRSSLGADLEVRAVVGAGNPHRASLEREVAAAPSRCSLVVPGQPGRAGHAPDMPELMAWADVAVSAAGTTCWELAFMQLPSLWVVLADNQRANAAALEARGVGLSLGACPLDCERRRVQTGEDRLAAALARLLADAEGRARMAGEGRRLVDGQGGRRVAGRLAQDLVRVRPVAAQDRELLFRWANDPLTRQMSLRTEAIDWEEHRAWFERVAGDPRIFLVIAEAWTAGRWTPAGQVRVDSVGVVSLALDPDFRGRRLARPVLDAALAVHRARCARSARSADDAPLTAYIRPENEASQRVFAQAGFQTAGWAEVMGQWLLKYTHP